VAGSHTISVTLSLLFWHLMYNPEIMAKVVQEIDANLPRLTPEQRTYSIEGLEKSIPYTMACIQENCRMDLVVTFPAFRWVGDKEGAGLGGHQIPYGVRNAVSFPC
jgi:cytochrome P450